jgi:TPR repeat protein
VLLAGAHLSGQGTRRDDQAALRIVEASCHAGGADSCALAGWAKQHGRGVPVNPIQAVELYTTGCTRGSGRACAELADIAEHKNPRDPGVFRFYERACVQGYLPGCTELARLYTAGVLVSADLNHAFALYRATCALDELPACVLLADLQEMPGNAAAAAALYQRACTEQSTLGCGKLAELYLGGKGVAVDTHRAFGLFERGCKNGDATACARVADLYREGRGTQLDRGRALTLYDQACDASVASACMQAGLMYRHAGRDNRAEDRYARACKLGDQAGCEHKR